MTLPATARRPISLRSAALGGSAPDMAGDCPPSCPNRSGCAIPVTESAHGLDRSRHPELPPQVADVELHLLARRILVTPHELEQLLVAEDLIRMADEGGQQP